MALMQAMGRQNLETPFYGPKRMKNWLERQGIRVSRRRVHRLMRTLELRGICRDPRTGRSSREYPVCPFLSEKVKVTGSRQVCADAITYLPMARSFLYR